MNENSSNSEIIRVGVVGVGRGQSFAQGADESIGMKLVALCDTWEERLKQVGEQYDVETYSDYEEFLKHDMDAVILANYFHQHAPFAVKALQTGKHVMSETMVAKTMAECIALCEAVEHMGLIYMFAENYPFSAANQEMRRLYREGEIGQVRYAEGEYNHAGEENWRLSISPGLNHWRNWLPSTYYCSHALAPLMCITDTMPVSVNALSVVDDSIQSPNTVKVSDPGGIILTRMDNGAVFRIFGLMLSSIHRVRYEIHGEKGLLGTAEPDHWGMIRIHHEDWLRKDNQPREKLYTPDWPEHAAMAKKAGHGGGDFWTNFHFANAIRSGEQPYLDVYRGTAMAAVGILGWRSCLEEGKPHAIPNFKDKQERKDFEDDHWSPFPEDAGSGQPPPSLKGTVAPGEAAIAHAQKKWLEMGYHDE